MSLTKDGFYKSFSGAIGNNNYLLEAGGGHIGWGNAASQIPYSNGTVNSNLNADMTDGLHVHGGRNNEPNKLVRTDGSGYIQAGWINTISGDMGTTSIDRIYCSNDSYIRYKTKANFINGLDAYWADIKISSSSSTTTTPQFGYVGIGTTPDSNYARLSFIENENAICFRKNTSYKTCIQYKTVGNEALVFATQQTITSFIFKCGYTMSNGSDWQSSVIGIPSIQIKGQSLYVNTAIANGSTPSYNFQVTGTSYFNGNTTHNGVIYLANGTTYWIDNSAIGYLNDLRVDQTRLVNDWLGFYSSNNAGGNRYGFIQANADRMYFRKENGVNSYAFDFGGGNIYTNGNYIFAGYFNSAISDENPTIGSVYIRNTSDNYIRRMSFSNFISQLGLLVNTSISTSGVGWFRIASYSTTSDMCRGLAKFSIITTGGSWSPYVQIIEIDGTWSHAGVSSCRIIGPGYITKVRTTYDSSNVYIEIYTSAALSGSLRIIKSNISYGNVNDSWSWKTGSLPAGGGTQVFIFEPDSNGLSINGNIFGTGFIKSGSNNNYVLLGGGSHKALSDFSMTHSHPYLPLAGGTMNSGAQIVVGSITNSSGNIYNGGIQLRERGYSTTSLDGTVYTDGPGITFHWGGRWVHMLNMHSNDIFWDNNKIWHAGNDGSGSGLDADLLDGYHANSFSLSGHTHTFKLGNTTITTNGSTYSSINGPLSITTDASSSKAFSIQRGSSSEGVQHWVDDSQYHIDYTNDETSSSIHIRVINIDTESPHDPRQTTDYHYYLDCYGNIYSGSNNTGSIGTSSYKWANMYATTFHGSLDGNATSATKVYVNYNTTSNANYALVWSNETSSDTRLSNQLYKSWDHLTYNPSQHALKTHNIIMGNASYAFIYRDYGAASGLESGFYFHSTGRESVVFANQYSHTGWIFANGIKPSDRKAWNSLGVTPAVQIHHNALYINRAVRDADTSDYNLFVNGTSYLGGETWLGSHGSNAAIGTGYSSSDTNRYNYIRFYNANDSGDIIYTAGLWTSGDHIAHKFDVNQCASALVIRNITGNIGISTNSPIEKLHISGNEYITGYINFNGHGYLQSGRSTSFNYGYTFKSSSQDLSNSMGMYSGPGGEEGAIVVTPNGCFIYNSSDSGFNFVCYDKDLGGNFETEAGSNRTFAILQSGHYAWSKGGFQKSGSNDNYALTGGGSHFPIHTGRNNEANKLVRTDGSGYIQAGYINSSSGDENNNSNPNRVWGTNGSDSYLRTYRTSALNVGSSTNLNRVSGGFSTGGSGWFKLASIKSTDARGVFRISIYTTGGNWIPEYCELMIRNGWGVIDFIQYGQSSYIDGYRYTIDDTYSYVEAHFTSNTTFSTLKFIGVGYVNDNNYDWSLYTSAVAGSGTVQGSEYTKTTTSNKLFINGLIKGSGFVKTSSSNNYVLLGGGGHESLSNLGSYHNHDDRYVNITGDTMTGDLHVYAHTYCGYGTGSSIIDYNVYAMYVGTNGTRTGTAGSYIGGIAFTHMIKYSGSYTYVNSPQGWIGLRTVDYPGSERSSLVFATKPGTGTSNTGDDIPQERMCITPAGSVGIGTTSPSQKLHISGGIIQINANSRYLQLGPQNSSWTHLQSDANFYFNKSIHVDGDIYLYGSSVRMQKSNGYVYSSGFYHNSYGSATYLLRSDGGAAAFNWSGQSGQPTWIWGGNSQHTYYVYNPSNFSVNYANYSGYSHKLDIYGYASDGLSFYQTSNDFDEHGSGWSHYIIANHGNGASYYHYTIALPFWGPPQYRRQTGSTSSVTSWYTFLTTENWTSIVDGRYLPLSGGWMNWTAQINFKGSGESTSVYSRIGYATGTINGVKMHTTQTNAFYICTNGDTSATDNAGLAIDNDGVTVFGAGDAGSVFRVLNEDNVSDGSQIQVTKSTGTYIRPRLSVGQNSINTSYNLYVNGTAYFTGELWTGSTIYSYGFYHRNYGSADYLLTSNGDAVYKTAIGPYGYLMKETLVDLSSLDGNTFYPVTFSLGAHSNVRIEVRVSLNTGQTDSNWMTHSGGFSCRAIWEVNGSGWGTNPIDRTIYAYDSAWTNVGNPCGEIGQMGNASEEYIYLRGHAKYYIYTSHNVSPTLRTSTYSAGEQSISTKSSINTDVSTFGTSGGIFQGLSYSGSTLSVTVGGYQRTCTINAGSSVTLTTTNTSNHYVIGVGAGSIPSNGSSVTSVYARSEFYFTNSGAYHSSDARKKYDIRDILNDDVNKLFETENGFIRHFKWINTNEDAYGFIAQELQEYCPEAVDFNNDTGFYSVNYNVALSKIVGAMFKKIKELEKRLKEKENL